MAFSIKDPGTDRIVRNLARHTGLGLTETVRVAVENELKRRGADTRTIDEKVADFVRRLDRRDLGPDTGLSREEIEAEMYDEYGLPR
ncbi:type II toxin-antitoxin system VapB family antitoxin [Caulobacter segnis]|jgi:antitoxin VapB|uniref:type II toxin-antitoxin system VapB family antitoxin n=1 Tax=Caulobacter segnis TaxID=88688 RepID=UPI001CBBB006|nr:type II toxin-antitoxin system VapB family antitoxin [Caulobacter segnis]UAL11897.1 type II toxin-antitoxin system VapB family antitoxin [Caulobacter segnis]